MAILSNIETEEGFFSVSTMAPQHPTTGKSSSIGNTSLVNWSSFRSTSSSTLEDHHRHNSSSSITTTSSLGSSLSSLFREGFLALAFLRDSDTERHFFEGVQHVKQNNTTKQQPKDKNSRGSISTIVHNDHNTTTGYEDDAEEDHEDSEHDEEDERDQEEIVCMRVTRSARTRHRSLLLNNDSRGLMNYDGDYGDDNTGDEGDDEDDHDDMLVNHKEEETALLRRQSSNASSSVTASTARSGGSSSSFRSQSKQLIKTDSDKAMRL